MTDSLEKVERYKKQRESTKGSECSQFYHEIREATEEEIEGGRYKRKGANRKTGWIGKNGWNPHT